MNESIVNDSLHEHSGAAHHDVTSVRVAKSVTMVSLCSISICLGLVPIFLSNRCKWFQSPTHANLRSTSIVQKLLGFGGGVLFCTTFLHMLPEVRENVDELLHNHSLPELPLPITEFLVCAGFFVMYLVEELVHSRIRSQERKDQENSVEYVVAMETLTIDDPKTEGSVVLNKSSGHSHLPRITTEDSKNVIRSSLRGLLIVLGLSIHEFFEGLAIGLGDNAGHVWYMFGAVAAHKFVIAFCIGIELVASGTPRTLSVVYVCTFAVVSPLGIGFGMIFIGDGSTAAGGVVPVILQGLATGTLLYVVFFEILHHNREGLTQYLSIIAGFAVMLILQAATPHSHSHGEHGHSHGEHGHSHHHGGHDDQHHQDEHGHHHHD